MKQLKTITLLLGVAVSMAACQQENLQEQENDLENFSLTTSMDKAGFVIHNDRAEFNLLCPSLIYEDFEHANKDLSYEFNNFLVFPSPFSSYTNNGIFGLGSIKPGIIIESLQNGNQDYIDIPLDEDAIRLLVGWFADEMVIDFTAGNVYTAGMEITSYSKWTQTETVFINVYGFSGLIYSTEVNKTESGEFFGITAPEPIKKISLTSPTEVGFFGIANISFGSCDSDGDGCLDRDDPITYSNMETTVQVGTCDTGVENRVTSECGIMMADKIDELEGNTYEQSAFLRRDMAILTDTWVGEGLISVEEQTAILDCVPVVPANRPARPERPVRGRP